MKKKLPIIFLVILISTLFVFLSINNNKQIISDDLQEIKETNNHTKIEKSKENPLNPFSEKKKKVKGIHKSDSPNLFAEWHRGIRTMPGKDASDYKINYQVDELLKAKNVNNTKGLAKSSLSSKLDWRELGPGNVAGRTRSILIHPDDHDLWYVGSVGGGVWKTPDAGKTWINLTTYLPNLATSALAWSESNPNIIYAGTGEGFGNVDQIDGSGIWKTTDAGETWNQLVSTIDNPDFENVMRMAVNPNNPDLIVVAVAPGFNYLTDKPSSGIYRSDDGGETWTKTYEAASSKIEDLRANPLNFNTQYASINGVTIIKSLDGGVTWFNSSNGLGAVSRMELAIAPSDTNIVYISAQGGASGSILYSTNDGGANWYFHDNPENNIHWLGGQGWYDNTIVVNPYDATNLFVGGPQLWQLDVTTKIDTSDIQLKNVEFINVDSFLSFVNFGGSSGNGAFEIGKKVYGIETQLSIEEYNDVEIRFGPGKSQKAHRFYYASEFQYPYVDYVEVPFEVWDINNNKQLMVSFRDDDSSGTWNPLHRDETSEFISREFIFIHSIEYSDSDANAIIANTAGIVYKNTYFVWPEGIAGTTFDPNNLPESSIKIIPEILKTRGIKTTNIADAYTYGAASKGIHVDHHALVIVKTDTTTQSYRLLNGNDGGIAFSDDKGATFSQTGNVGRYNEPGDYPNEIFYGYNTTQFYGIDKANGIDRYVGGMQDNGSWLSPENPDENSKWVGLPSGDGYEASWHYTDLNKIIETSQYNGIYRTLDGGENWEFIGSKVDYGSGIAPFFTKIGKSKQDPDLIFTIGASGIWRSDNFGSSFTLTEAPDGFLGNSSFSQVKVSLCNPQIVWTAYGMYSTRTPLVSTDGGLTFNPTNVYSDVQLGRISGFETHPTEDSTAYALISTSGTPKILKTTDLGNSWKDLSGFGANSTSSNGFPDVAVYSLIVMPYNTDILWAGTEIGLFESTDGGQNWKYSDNGLPPVAVYDMVIVNDEVVIATHGRGAWSVSIPELNGYEPQETILSPRFAAIEGGARGVLDVKLVLPSVYDSTKLFVNEESYISFSSNDTFVDTNITVSILVSSVDTASLKIISYLENKVYKSPDQKAEIYGLKDAVTSYSNNFDGDDNYFLNSGFDIFLADGFESAALHTEHPYMPGKEYSAFMQTPLIISEQNTILSYEDIVLVEPGDEGTKFGQFEFWDYVLVVGSNDLGQTWQPLIEGYDATYDSVWLNQYNNPSPIVSPDMFRKHEINLNDFYESGEEILILFTLYSDAITTGFGWVIDNIEVNGEIVDVKETTVGVPNTFTLDQNYPNPFNPTTTIKFGLPQDNNVSIKVFNILGQQVTTLINQQLKAGYHSINWNAADISSGIYFYRIEAGNFVDTKKMLLLK